MKIRKPKGWKPTKDSMKYLRATRRRAEKAVTHATLRARKMQLKAKFGISGKRVRKMDQIARLKAKGLYDATEIR